MLLVFCGVVFWVGVFCYFVCWFDRRVIGLVLLAVVMIRNAIYMYLLVFSVFYVICSFGLRLREIVGIVRSFYKKFEVVFFSRSYW